MMKKFCLFALLAVAGGCDTGAPCPTCRSGPVHVVLTFDDGPLPAPIDDPALASTPDAQLQPLHDILATLAQRAATGLFFVTPRSQATADAAPEALARGLQDIHANGHLLAYHAFSHDPGIWINSSLPPPVAEVLMSLDLSALQTWIDKTLAPLGAARDDWFQPVFRQPYGGAGFFVFEGADVARLRGLVYRGYWIDSGDWLANSETDPALRAQLPSATEQEQNDYVHARILDGIAAHLDHDTIDVLFHVNGLTAGRLGEWLDEIRLAYAAQQRGPVVFDVPDTYLKTTDVFVDTHVGEDILQVPH